MIPDFGDQTSCEHNGYFWGGNQRRGLSQSGHWQRQLLRAVRGLVAGRLNIVSGFRGRDKTRTPTSECKEMASIYAHIFSRFFHAYSRTNCATAKCYWSGSGSQNASGSSGQFASTVENPATLIAMTVSVGGKLGNSLWKAPLPLIFVVNVPTREQF